MNRVLMKRAAGLAAAVLMMVLWVAGAIPVAAEEKTCQVNGGNPVSAQDGIVASLEVSGFNVVDGEYDVTVYGGGSFTGSCKTPAKFISGKATVNVTSGISYNGGESKAQLLVSLGTESQTFTVTNTLIADNGNSGSDPPTPPVIAGNVFTVESGAAVPEISAGQSGTISYPIFCNKSLSGDVQVEAELPDQIYFTTASAIQTMKFKRNETKNVELQISADSGLKSGVYPVTLKFTYKYGGTSHTDEVTTYLKVNGAAEEGAGKLSVTGYTVTPSTVNAGEKFKLNVTVKNTGTAAYKDATVTLGGSLSTDAFTMDGTLDSQQIASLAAGASTTLTFSLCSHEKMTSGNYIIDISVAAGETTVSSKAFVPVKGKPENDNKDEENKNESVPQLIIESYSYGEEGATSVTGGKIFTLTANIRNAGKIPVQNVKITISSAADAQTGGAFSPANSSNTFFIENIPAGGVITESIDLLPKADASPKSYGIDFDFSYEAIVNKTLTEKAMTQTIAIPLVQPDRFEVAEPQLYGPVYVGDTLNGYVSYVNKGKSAIFNLSVKIEGEGFTTGEAESYIGNVESGSGDGFELNLNPIQAGEIKGTILFTYEDANGETKEITKEFTSQAMEMDFGNDEPIDPGMDMPIDVPPQGGMPMWGWIAIAVGGAVVAVVVVVIVVKAVKKKKQKALDAEDDFDDDDGAGK